MRRGRLVVDSAAGADSSDRAASAAGARYGLVGGSRAVRELVAFIDQAAASDSTVLVEGASGTGKELVVQALHHRSGRSAGPFVEVNCAALPDSLLESELFGHERGAFTGAAASQPGKFERAAGGTLFLDEIGELPLELQAKLLRALETRRIERIGGREPKVVDFRLVAATNRDMDLELEAGRFRLDLYHRLKVVSVRTPPLADRREDIVPLARHFLRMHANALERGVRTFSPAVPALLKSYPWPGNVRELRNAIEHAVVMASGDTIGLGELPPTLVRHAGVGMGSEISNEEMRRISGAGPPEDLLPFRTYHEIVNETRRRVCEAAFQRASGDYRQAAALLGLHPKTVHRLLHKLGLQHWLRKPAH